MNIKNESLKRFLLRNKSKIVWIAFGLIIIMATFLRFYKLDQVPPSLSWDEVAVGYNAYTIANWGKDEWGQTLPFYFKSFEENKHPVDIYLTAISIKIFGLSDYATRSSSALFGILSVIIIFFLGKELFKNNYVGLIAALFLAISPYDIHFSRFNHEFNFAIFFFMLGLLLFFYAIEGRRKLLPLSVLSFGITFVSYNSAKIVVPLTILLLSALYFKQLIRFRRELLISLVIFLIFLGIIIFNPALLGGARAKQTLFSEGDISKTEIYKKTGNYYLGYGEIIFKQYISHFSLDYLFISGDKNPRLSSQGSGEFYKIDIIFLLIGLITLLWKRSKISIILLFWALIAPIPSAIAQEAPHAARAMFTCGSWTLIAALGCYQLIYYCKKIYLKALIILIFLAILSYEFSGYLGYYFSEYPKRYAIEWQYGMKQAAEYIKENNGYFQIYATDVRSQPYIFFLYYLQEPLLKFLETVKYNQTESRSHNLVTNFDNFYFGGNLTEAMPNYGDLYILTPSEYDGLRYKNTFNIKKKILYPNGTDAFFLVSYP